MLKDTVKTLGMQWLMTYLEEDIISTDAMRMVTAQIGYATVARGWPHDAMAKAYTDAMNEWPSAIGDKQAQKRIRWQLRRERTEPYLMKSVEELNKMRNTTRAADDEGMGNDRRGMDNDADVPWWTHWATTSKKSTT